jgi:hypothetical protein
LQGNYLPNNTAAAIAAVQRVQSQSDETPVFVPEPQPVDKFPGDDVPFTRLNTEFSSSLAQFREDARFVGIDGTGFVSVVIDSGADLDHPHFGPDSDGDGIADRIVHQQSYTGSASADDDHGHGTHVQGIVGSSDPDYLGVAPESNFVALKALAANGRGSFAWLEDALQWVVTNATTFNIASVNMSLSDGGFHTEAASRYGIGDELAALEALDVIVVSASGNSYSGSPGVGYPSADPNSLSIGSERTSGGLSSFSQRDPELTTVFAPGQVITAAWPGGGVRGLQGTSMASPQVAGVATLAQQLAVQELGRRLTVAEFNQLLRSTGPDAGSIPETGSSYPGVNMVRLGEAILALDGAAVDLEVTAISQTIGGSRGDGGTVDFTVSNNGSADAPASKLDVYLSRNGTISWTGDYLLGTYDVPALTAGSSTQGSLDVTLPEPNDSFWDSDVNYSIGTIVDSEFVVAESDEVNNFNSPTGGDKLDLVIENLPRNLIADNIVISSAPEVWGEVGEVTFDVVNLGGGPSQATSAAVYLSKDSTIDAGSDLFLGSLDVPRVDGSSSVSRLMNFELPDSGDEFWDVGITDYYIGVFVDSNNSETESDESDNGNRGVGEDIAEVPLVPPPATISGAVFVDREADGVFHDRFDEEFTVTHNFPGSINPFQAKTFTWTDLPEYRDNATLTIRMLADIGAASRNLSVVLDGEVQMVYFAGDLPEGTGIVLAERTMDLAGDEWQSAINDGELQISVDVNFSGSFTTNNRNFIEATLSYTAESQDMASYSQQATDSVIRGTQNVDIPVEHQAIGEATLEFMAVGYLGGATRTATLTLEDSDPVTFFEDTPASNDPLVYEQESITIPQSTLNSWLDDGRISGTVAFSNAVSAQYPGSTYELRLRYPILADDGVSQRLVTLDIGNDGSIDATTLTTVDDPSTSVDESGYYEFADVPFGEHLVSYSSTEGWDATSSVSQVVEVVPGFSNPNVDFGAHTSTIVGGVISEDTLWDNTDQSYYLAENIRIENDATLTIAPGVGVERLNLDYDIEVGTSEQGARLEVEKAVLATGLVVHPTGNVELDIVDLTEGVVDVSGSFRGTDLILAADLQVNEGANVGIRFSEFAESHVFVIHSGADVDLFYNDFSRVSENGIRALGDATATINLTRNWWDTNDESAIAAKILDNQDDDALPTVDFGGLLDVFPVLGDANHDGRLTNTDIGPFILALTNRTQYESDFPAADPSVLLDFNWTGSFTNTDIAGFVNALTGGRSRNHTAGDGSGAGNGKDGSDSQGHGGKGDEGDSSGGSNSRNSTGDSRSGRSDFDNQESSVPSIGSPGAWSGASSFTASGSTGSPQNQNGKDSDLAIPTQALRRRQCLPVLVEGLMTTFIAMLTVASRRIPMPVEMVRKSTWAET